MMEVSVCPKSYRGIRGRPDLLIATTKGQHTTPLTMPRLLEAFDAVMAATDWDEYDRYWRRRV